MTAHNDTISLQQMLDHAREDVAFASSSQRELLDSDRRLYLSLMQLMQIIGEAANRVSGATCAIHPEIPWSQIIAARNRLIHGYDSINRDILWNIVSLDLPKLVQSLEAILESDS